MKLYEYMKLRNGVGRRGTIKFSLSMKEFNLLGIPNKKGWARNYKNFDIPEHLIDQLSQLAIENKSKHNKSVKRLETNFQSKDNKFLYLMYNASTKCHKIGISVDPKKRSQNLTGGAGVSIILKAMWKIEEFARDVEKFVHTQLKDVRTIGEWFDLTSFENPTSIVESHIPCQFKRVI